MIYATLFKDRHMMPVGFSMEGTRDTFEIRLRLAEAALDSIGYELHFASEPGDAAGDMPDDGYEQLRRPQPGARRAGDPPRRSPSARALLSERRAEKRLARAKREGRVKTCAYCMNPFTERPKRGVCKRCAAAGIEA